MSPSTHGCVRSLGRGSAVALLALAALLISLAAGDTAAAKPGKFKGPKGPAFYDPPKRLIAKRHGKLIWQRPTSPLMRLRAAKSTRTIAFTSRSPQGKPIPVSGSVSVPKGKAPKRGWPVITYAHGTTGAADACAPTRIGKNNVNAEWVNYTNPQLNAWLRAGYAVVRTDYQGLGTPGPHPYLVGESEGRGVIDIISAARQLRPAIGKRFLIAGHSQGGHAALFASSLAKRWAPKLRLRGTVAYAPASHVLEEAKALPLFTTPSPLSGLVALILEGASTASPQVVPDQLLTDKALALYPLVNELCVGDFVKDNTFGDVAPADMLRPDADTGPLYDVLAAMNPAVKTPQPILLAQGLADTTVLPVLTEELHGQLVALGDDVDFVTYPGVIHGEIVAAAEQQAMEFFEQRLPGGR